jgi:hypothetical protein
VVALGAHRGSIAFSVLEQQQRAARKARHTIRRSLPNGAFQSRHAIRWRGDSGFCSRVRVGRSAARRYRQPAAAKTVSPAGVVFCGKYDTQDEDSAAFSPRMRRRRRRAPPRAACSRSPTIAAHRRRPLHRRASGHLTASTDATPTIPVTSNQAKHEQITDVITALTATARRKPRPRDRHAAQAVSPTRRFERTRESSLRLGLLPEGSPLVQRRTSLRPLSLSGGV